MLYLHFCLNCNRIHLLSGHRIYCPACDKKLQELSVAYENYINMDTIQRTNLLSQCKNAHTLDSLRSSYTPRYQRKKLNCSKKT